MSILSKKQFRLKSYIVMFIICFSLCNLVQASGNNLKLLFDSDQSANKSTLNYYWAKEITGDSSSAVGDVYGVGSICGLTQNSQFEIELVVAGKTTGTQVRVGLKFLTYDKKGTQLNTVNVFWNTPLTADYSIITKQFTIPAQSGYTIKDIHRMRAVVYNIDSPAAKIMVKGLKLSLNEDTLLKNLYYGPNGTVMKDGEGCIEFSSGESIPAGEVNVKDFCNFNSSTIFEYQIKALCDASELLGVKVKVFDGNDNQIGSPIDLISNQSLS